jgi:hypothetical protein
MIPQDWPHLLRPLVAKFGAGAVWEVGLRVLNYPPTWATDGSERRKIESELFKK